MLLYLNMDNFILMLLTRNAQFFLWLAIKSIYWHVMFIWSTKGQLFIQFEYNVLFKALWDVSGIYTRHKSVVTVVKSNCAELNQMLKLKLPCFKQSIMDQIPASAFHYNFSLLNDEQKNLKILYYDKFISISVFLVY